MKQFARLIFFFLPKLQIAESRDFKLCPYVPSIILERTNKRFSEIQHSRDKKGVSKLVCLLGRNTGNTAKNLIIKSFKMNLF